MPKKKTVNKTTDQKEELKDFDIKINEFGEITTSVELEKLNEFLDENVEDKKLKETKKEEKEEE